MKQNNTKEKIDSELVIFWDKMSEYLPKSFERSALGDEKIFTALKQAYIEFRPLIADEVLKVVKKEIFGENLDEVDMTTYGWILLLLDNLSPNKENEYIVNVYHHNVNSSGKCPTCGLYDSMCDGGYGSCNKEATKDFRGSPMCEKHYRDCCIRFGVAYGRDKEENIPA